jgi:hypothetical protein
MVHRIVLKVLDGIASHVEGFIPAEALLQRPRLLDAVQAERAIVLPKPATADEVPFALTSDKPVRRKGP